MKKIGLLFLVFVSCNFIFNPTSDGHNEKDPYDPLDDLNHGIYGEWLSIDTPKVTLYFEPNFAVILNGDEKHETSFQGNSKQIIYQTFENDSSYTIEYKLINDSTLTIKGLIADSLSFKRTSYVNPILLGLWQVDSVGDTSDFLIGDNIEFLNKNNELKVLGVDSLKFMYEYHSKTKLDVIAIRNNIKLSEVEYTMQLDSTFLKLIKGNSNNFKVYSKN